MPHRHRRPHPESPEETVAADGSSQPGPPEAPSREDAQDELIRLLTFEKDQVNDQLLRTMADLQNFRKRAQQEKDQLRQFAAEQIVLDLLPVLDNFERTKAAAESGASVEALREGVSAVERQLRQVLDSRGVAKLAALGHRFDPLVHEAVGTVDSDKHEGTIVEEVEPGYKMGNKVIRPARVKVAKKP